MLYVQFWQRTKPIFLSFARTRYAVFYFAETHPTLAKQHYFFTAQKGCKHTRRALASIDSRNLKNIFALTDINMVVVSQEFVEKQSAPSSIFRHT